MLWKGAEGRAVTGCCAVHFHKATCWERPSSCCPFDCGKAGALVPVFFLLSGDHTWTSRSQVAHLPASFQVKLADKHLALGHCIK